MYTHQKNIIITVLCILSICGCCLLFQSLYNILQPLEIVNVDMAEGIQDASGIHEIQMELNHPVKKLEFTMNNKVYRTKVNGKKATLSPVNLFPGSAYQFSVFSASPLGYTSKSSFTIQTATIDETLWIEVVKEPINKVNVYQNNELIRVMIASCGEKGFETPSGTYRIKGRGESFSFKEFDTTAKYWLCFAENYLFHSIPYDKNGHILAEEILKLGTPSTQGNICLTPEDAKWLYENIPDGTLVVIRENKSAS